MSERRERGGLRRDKMEEKRNRGKGGGGGPTDKLCPPSL